MQSAKHHRTVGVDSQLQALVKYTYIEKQVHTGMFTRKKNERHTLHTEHNYFKTLICYSSSKIVNILKKKNDHFDYNEEVKIYK